MRKSNLTSEEVSEIDEFQKRESRNTGFSLMSVRDRGFVELSNGVVMNWHVDRPLLDGEARQVIPSGKVMIDGKVYESEELLKFLRWA